MSTGPGPKPKLNTYVIVAPYGLVYVGLHEDERDCWRIFLGWPTVGEVRERINAGWYCAKAEITWRMPDTYPPRMVKSGSAG